MGTDKGGSICCVNQWFKTQTWPPIRSPSCWVKWGQLSRVAGQVRIWAKERPLKIQKCLLKLYKILESSLKLNLTLTTDNLINLSELYQELKIQTISAIIPLNPINLSYLWLHFCKSHLPIQLISLNYFHAFYANHLLIPLISLNHGFSLHLCQSPFNPINLSIMTFTPFILITQIHFIL